jgi:hypothetical protein
MKILETFLGPNAAILATGFPRLVTVISSPAPMFFKTRAKFFWISPARPYSLFRNFRG